MKQFEGKCYGGPWDGRQITARAPRFELMKHEPIKIQPRDAASPYETFSIAGSYSWWNGKEEGETRGEHWQWKDEL